MFGRGRANGKRRLSDQCLVAIDAVKRQTACCKEVTEIIGADGSTSRQVNAGHMGYCCPISWHALCKLN